MQMNYSIVSASQPKNWAGALQQEKPPQWEAHTQLESSPHSS